MDGAAGELCGKDIRAFLEQLVTIELFGQPYTFKTQGELGRAKEVADFLVREVTRVANHQPNNSAKMNQVTIMILAALNIAQEYMELEKDRSQFIREITKRSTELLHKLDTCCAEAEETDVFSLRTGT
jgi:cell division protein ZapA (FtsZ GTPase activity inhibitor)